MLVRVSGIFAGPRSSSCHLHFGRQRILVSGGCCGRSRSPSLGLESLSRSVKKVFHNHCLRLGADVRRRQSFGIRFRRRLSISFCVGAGIVAFSVVVVVLITGAALVRVSNLIPGLCRLAPSLVPVVALVFVAVAV